MLNPIIAVITADRNKIGGGVPIFYCETREEIQTIAFTLEKILDATAHDVKNGTMIIVKHE